MLCLYYHHIINPNSNGGGEQDTPCDAKFCEKCPNNNNTALIQQISLFDTALKNN